MPLFEKDYWRWMFPVAWLARLVQAVVILAPNYWVSLFSQVPERRLESRCRWFMSIGRIRHGLPLLFRPLTSVVSELPEDREIRFLGPSS